MDLINSLRDLIKHLREPNGFQQSAEQIKIRAAATATPSVRRRVYFPRREFLPPLKI